MPLDPISAAIVSSLIGSAVESALTPAAPRPATGLVRHLPAEAKRGVMGMPADGRVQIDGQTYLLSPGVVIRNEYNMAIPSMLVSAPVLVRYQTDAMGAVSRVWILSAAEAQLAEAQK
ncbi:hypothetical protein [Sulfuricystis multivorans]|uniref:hypothetical protein n=1 Tax=Sulfuricystis multivorans TaxID=2211108 RepID=UPI0024E007BD|nr:hypothetical protein [Sulfuricystis multivorans]